MGVAVGVPGVVGWRLRGGGWCVHGMGWGSLFGGLRGARGGVGGRVGMWVGRGEGMWGEVVVLVVHQHLSGSGPVN